MKRLLLVPAAALILSAGLMTSTASATPAAGQQSFASDSLVDTIGHRCTRVCKGWGFKRRCKTVCRSGGHHHHDRRHHH